MKIKQDLLEQYDLLYSDHIEKVESKYAPRIGRIFIRFSELEHTLDIAIAEHLFERSHHLGYLVIEGSSLNHKIELFRKLYRKFTEHLLPNRLKKFQNIVKRLHEARIFRNYVAHANWLTLDKNGYVRTRVGEKEGEIIFKKVRITPLTLEAWDRRINRLDNLLSEFVDEASQAIFK